MKISSLAVALLSLVGFCQVALADDQPLQGTVIGTEISVDYNSGSSSTTVNTRDMAFDGDLSTYFASYDRSYTWVGLDLGQKHVITRVGWSPRNDNLGPGRVVLGMFQGANREDFLDAVPIYLIDEKGTIGQMSYADVDCSRGFRYVRYVGPSDARCNIAEVQFYGTPDEGDDSHLYQLTNLPTVVINTVDAEEPYDKEHNITSEVIIISNNGAKVLDATATTRLRGNASMEFPKKPYRIKFDKKQNVLDAPAKAKKWTLINNYGDKTLMRNIIAFESARRAGMEYVPFCTPVDVILNGEYKGDYQLCDQIEVNSKRVNIEEMEPTDVEGDALTGGYLLEVDAYAYQETSWFTSTHNIPVTIKSPDEEDIVAAQTQYITNAFNDLDQRVFSGKYSGEGSYREIFDVNSFLQHFIVGEFSGNTDTYWSTYMYKHRNNDTFYVGPVWDFDLAFDNDTRIYPVNNHSNYIYLYGSHADNMDQFVTRVISRDSATAAELKALWNDIRNNAEFTGESFNNYIDNLAQEMDASLRLNFMRWPILNQYVHQNPKVYSTYADAIADVKDYVTARIAWLDKKIGYTPSSGIADVADAQSSLVAYVADGAVRIAGQTTDADAVSYGVYDLAGRLIGNGSNASPVQLPARGVYLVTAPGLASKLLY
jgi:hypothetical protein